MQTNQVLCDIRHLKKYFTTPSTLFSAPNPPIKAVDDISFTIKNGETLGLVGESGCGKTTVGRTMVRLYKPSHGSFAFSHNNALYDIFSLSDHDFYPLKKNIQMIFQDPYSSLNPRMTVKNIIEEGLLRYFQHSTKKERIDKISEILEKVGLQPSYMQRFPHEFSGGQRQRIGIARSLIIEPQFVICDEPVSALDVSVQAQIINLLEELKDSYSLTYLFIAHDLSVVKHIADRIAVMYKGIIVESGTSDEIFFQPRHPYSQLLFDSIPLSNPHKRKQNVSQTTQSEISHHTTEDNQCTFYHRCPHRLKMCRENTPELISYANEHSVACFLHNQKAKNL